MDTYIHWIHSFQQWDSFPRGRWRWIRWRAWRLFHWWVRAGVWENKGLNSTKWSRSLPSLWSTHWPRSPEWTPTDTVFNNVNQKWGREIKEWRSSTVNTDPVTSALTNPHLRHLRCPTSHDPTRLHCWHCQECMYGSVASGHFISESEERFPCVLGIEACLAWGAAKAEEGESQDVTQPFGSSSCPLYTHTEPEEWLTF